MWTNIALILLVIILVVTLFFSVRRNIRNDDRFEELGDQIKESLDILDECYQRISRTADTPVTSDDPIIQQLVSDIKYAKHAILLIAHKVVVFDGPDDDDE